MENNQSNSYIDESDLDNEYCKVILVGESGVGKTSIINRFTKQQFVRDVISSTGGTFSTKKIEYDIDNTKKAVSFEIWDTAGQERYRAMAKMFFKEAACAIIVYDITNKKSFEEIKNYWVNEVKNNSPEKIMIYIIGNKDDLYLEEQVDEEEARSYAKEINADFRTVSALRAKGIDDIFWDVGKKYLQNSANLPEDSFKQRSRLKADSNNMNNNRKRGCCQQ